MIMFSKQVYKLLFTIRIINIYLPIQNCLIFTTRQNHQHVVVNLRGALSDVVFLFFFHEFKMSTRNNHSLDEKHLLMYDIRLL